MQERDNLKELVIDGRLTETVPVTDRHRYGDRECAVLWYAVLCCCVVCCA